MGAGAIFGIIWIVYNIIKEALQPTIPAEHWKNQELMNEDILNPDVSIDELMDNLESGKYR